MGRGRRRLTAVLERRIPRPSADAGRLVKLNPFNGLGGRGGRGRADERPPSQEGIARLVELADELTPPSFADYLVAAIFSAARPGELDALREDDLDFEAREIRIERQWNAKLRKLTPPKHRNEHTIAMVEPLAERLLSRARTGTWAFETETGDHYRPSTRNHHWNRVRAAAGMGNVPLYLATRHHFGWFALNVLDLPPHVIADQLGHRDGGRLVQRTYGHPDAKISRERIRQAYATYFTEGAIDLAAERARRRADRGS